MTSREFRDKALEVLNLMDNGETNEEDFPNEIAYAQVYATLAVAQALRELASRE